MLRKKKKAPAEVQDLVLSDRLSFLDVIVEACKHSGRFTLIADSGDATYTVMIDRGGPFNADGGGLSGSAVLVKAASLRQGTYTKLEGWPVDQPVYQLGLADALQGLIMGTRPEPAPLPLARGVDAIRNAAWETVGKPPPSPNPSDPFAVTAANGRPPDAFGPATGPFAPATSSNGGMHQTPQPAGPWTMAASPTPIPTPVPTPTQVPTPSVATAPADHPFMAAFAPMVDEAYRPAAPTETTARVDPAIALAEPEAAGAAPTVASAAVAEAVPEPLFAEAAPEPPAEDLTPNLDYATELEGRLPAAQAVSESGAAMVEAPAVTATAAEVVAPAPAAEAAIEPGQPGEPADTISYLREAARASDSVDPTAAPPAARKPPGRIKRRVLQFLLWTVEVDGEPDQYTMGQAMLLLGRSLGAGLAMMINPVTEPFVRRWHQVRDDWRRSGEATARKKSQRAKAPRKPSRAKR